MDFVRAVLILLCLCRVGQLYPLSALPSEAVREAGPAPELRA